MEQSKGERNAASLPDTYALTKRQRYQRLFAQLDTDRQTFYSHWKDLNDYIMPRRGRFLITDRNKGDRRTKNIIDSTATQAAGTLSSGMMSNITNPARPWFRLTTPDPDLAESGAVKEWLHVVTQRMQTVFLKSNWYNVLPDLYYDLGVFGTSAMMIEEDERDVIRCTSFPVGSYLLANDSRGETNVFMREYGMTADQLVDKFTDGKDLSNLSDKVQQALKNNRGQDWVDVVHAITPNKEHDVNKLESKYKAFTDCYYEKSGNPDRFLREAGFDEFPIMAPIWSATGEDTYATNCPGMTALGDIKQLQLGEKRGMQAIEKNLNPPLVGSPSMRNFKVSEIAGDITYVPESQFQTLRPLHEVKPDIAGLEAKQSQIRERINRVFYVDLFLMLAYADATKGKQPVTAAEIAERHDEKLLGLGPVVGQVERKLLNPAVDRVFPIMVRAGLIPEPPRELEGVPLRVEFLSVVAQAQKSVGISGLERLTGFVSNLAIAHAQSVDSPIWDKLDTDQSVDEYADMMGVPPRSIVDDDKVSAIRDQRQKAQQAQQAAQLAEQTSKTAKNLAQAPVDPNNALGQVVGSIGGAQAA